MVDCKVVSTWTRPNGDPVTYTNILSYALTDDEAMGMAYAIRDGLRLHGYDAEVVISTEASVE